MIFQLFILLFGISFLAPIAAAEEDYVEPIMCEENESYSSEVSEPSPEVSSTPETLLEPEAIVTPEEELLVPSGEENNTEEAALVSDDLQVTEETPPAIEEILPVTEEVPIEESLPSSERNVVVTVEPGFDSCKRTVDTSACLPGETVPEDLGDCSVAQTILMPCVAEVAPKPPAQCSGYYRLNPETGFFVLQVTKAENCADGMSCLDAGFPDKITAFSSLPVELEGNQFDMRLTTKCQP